MFLTQLVARPIQVSAAGYFILDKTHTFTVSNLHLFLQKELIVQYYTIQGTIRYIIINIYVQYVCSRSIIICRTMLYIQLFIDMFIKIL